MEPTLYSNTTGAYEQSSAAYAQLASIRWLSTGSYERRTKIVCSVGPKAHSVDMIAEMLRAGMNIARQNFSHDDHETHYERFRNFKQASSG